MFSKDKGEQIGKDKSVKQQIKIQQTQVKLQETLNTQLNQNIANLQIDDREVLRNLPLLYETQNKIRQFYLNSNIMRPQNFCSYASFAKVFPPPNIYQAYKAQNLNIIDVHLRYHQYVFQKLSIYKWVPSIAFAIVTKLHPIGLVFPIIYFKFVDKYFKDFLIWKCRNQKIINIRSQFITKLSKQKNILRRVILFNKIKDDLLRRQDQVPTKYIKFGQSTQYIFHTTMKDIEQSSIYLTPFFQNFMNIKGIGPNSFSELKTNIKNLINEFKQYKNIKNKNQLPIFIDYTRLLTYKQIKQAQKYNMSKQIELRIRRFLQLWKYYSTGKFFMSGFTISDLMHLNKHYDLLSPQRFNLQDNSADFTIFYGTVFMIKLGQFIMRRSMRM